MKEKEDWDKHLEEWSEASTALYTNDEFTSVKKEPKVKKIKKKKPIESDKAPPAPFQHKLKFHLTEPRIKGV
jgi:hypothetical protein